MRRIGLSQAYRREKQAAKYRRKKIQVTDQRTGASRTMEVPKSAPKIRKTPQTYYCNVCETKIVWAYKGTCLSCSNDSSRP